jgi:hypothetical protein
MKNSYAVIWHYKANHGIKVILASSKQDAVNKMPWKDDKNITYYVTQAQNITKFQGKKKVG